MHNSKTKYWYQQRGGYTYMDETGIDFALNEKQILKKLETMNVYELEPRNWHFQHIINFVVVFVILIKILAQIDEKLKILSCLCHQLMSQLRFRDLIEDNFQKLNTLRAQLRDLQTEENRRIREEVSERWKKKMMDKAKVKARVEENKLTTNGQTNPADPNK